MFKKICFLWLIIALTTVSSCNPHLLPPANAALVTDLNILMHDIQSLYDNPDPSFSQPAHDRVDAEISAIVATESTRPHSAGFQASAKRIRDMFTKFETEYKTKGTLTRYVRDSHRDDMYGIIRPLLISEMTIK